MRDAEFNCPRRSVNKVAPSCECATGSRPADALLGFSSRPSRDQASQASRVGPSTVHVCRDLGRDDARKPHIRRAGEGGQAAFVDVGMSPMHRRSGDPNRPTFEISWGSSRALCRTRRGREGYMSIAEACGPDPGVGLRDFPLIGERTRVAYADLWLAGDVRDEEQPSPLEPQMTFPTVGPSHMPRPAVASRGVAVARSGGGLDQHPVRLGRGWLHPRVLVPPFPPGPRTRHGR